MKLCAAVDDLLHWKDFSLLKKERTRNRGCQGQLIEEAFRVLSSEQRLLSTEASLGMGRHKAIAPCLDDFSTQNYLAQFCRILALVLRAI